MPGARRRPPSGGGGCPAGPRSRYPRAARRAPAIRAPHSAAGIGRQRERGRRGLAEVEVLAQVAQDRLALTHVGPGIGASVGLGIDALTVEEVVLDELVERVEAQGLVVD